MKQLTFEMSSPLVRTFALAQQLGAIAKREDVIELPVHGSRGITRKSGVGAEFLWALRLACLLYI